MAATDLVGVLNGSEALAALQAAASATHTAQGAAASATDASHAAEQAAVAAEQAARSVSAGSAGIHYTVNPEELVKIAGMSVSQLPIVNWCTIHVPAPMYTGSDRSILLEPSVLVYRLCST